MYSPPKASASGQRNQRWKKKKKETEKTENDKE
jgi:hypothetical protein